MTMGKVIRLAAALGMALVLTACGSNNTSIKNARDDALARVMELETLLQQAQDDLAAARQKAMDDLAAKQAELDGLQGMLDQANMDLTSARDMLNQANMDLAAKQTELEGVQGRLDQANMDLGATQMERDNLQTQVTTLTGERDGLQTQVTTLTGERDGLQTNLNTAQGAIDAAVAALRAAGVQGADLAALVAVAVADVEKLKRRQDAENTETVTANRKNWATLHGLLATLNANEDGATMPDDATEMSTKADPTMTAWAALYDIPNNGKATVGMAVSGSRKAGAWSEAVIAGRSVSSDESGNLSAMGTFRGVSGTFTCLATATCGNALTFDKDGKVTNGADGTGWMFEADGGITTMIPF